MADFELNIDTRAFGNRGVRVGFDENRYGSLLDSLAEVVPVDMSPRLQVGPAPIWGMTKTRRIICELARDAEMYPGSRYLSSTRSIKLDLDEHAEPSNGLLLNGTKRWSTDVSGELGALEAARHQHRWEHRGVLGATTGGGAATGYLIGQELGAFVGGVAGLTLGLGARLRDEHISPYEKSIREFVKDPDVLAEYGQIISYEVT